MLWAQGSVYCLKTLGDPQRPVRLGDQCGAATSRAPAMKAEPLLPRSAALGSGSSRLHLSCICTHGVHSVLCQDSSPRRPEAPPPAPWSRCCRTQAVWALLVQCRALALSSP